MARRGPLAPVPLPSGNQPKLTLDPAALLARKNTLRKVPDEPAPLGFGSSAQHGKQDNKENQGVGPTPQAMLLAKLHQRHQAAHGEGDENTDVTAWSDEEG